MGGALAAAHLRRSRNAAPSGGRPCAPSIPAFIPRNHRIEAVIRAAVRSDDFAPFEELLTVLAKPFEDQPDYAAYAEPPHPISASADVLRDVKLGSNRASTRR